MGLVGPKAVPPPKAAQVPRDCDWWVQSGMVGPNYGVTSRGPLDKAAGGHSDLGPGPESGRAGVNVTCDLPDWSYSYSILCLANSREQLIHRDGT